MKSKLLPILSAVALTLVGGLLQALPEAEAPQFERLIVQTTDQLNPTNNILNIVDPFHTKMLSTGLYNQADVDALKADSFSYFLSQFGLDFANGVYNATLDSYTIPAATYYPYGVGLDKVHKLAYDSAHPLRVKTGDWFFMTFGAIVIMNANGTFPGGATYKAGDFLIFFESNLVRDGSNWHFPIFREVVQMKSRTTSQQFLNSENRVEQHSKFNVIDDNGHVGYGLLSISVNNLPNGDVSQKNRGVFTWE